MGADWCARGMPVRPTSRAASAPSLPSFCCARPTTSSASRSGAYSVAGGAGTGKVYLVGAGPGDPRLITLRGVECLRVAEVVIFDRLASPELLDHAPPGAERIFVGKGPRQHTMTQDEINALLVERGLAGNIVVRLKGGDPYVFGRGGEEVLALVGAGVPFEVVPGITSAIAGPSFAGIPVTHRQIASSFAVVTGHEDPTKPESAMRWAGLANGPDTLVFLMGVENLQRIVESLQRHGRPASQPAAAIRWAATPD